MQLAGLIDTQSFTIDYHGKAFDVSVETIGIDAIYLVKYPGGGLFIALVRATGLHDPKFWATIPENAKRHEEAQEVGKLIFQHFNPAR